ncbi:transposase family protein [Sinorhizobium terangae]|uniref:transposase family protein n=1 Tax=Sinorhizobium terangae TaxID=110322 RepID=UPI0024B086BE|nr:transposase family protein [Sinorhizobium terangae]WFU52053.1 transposase family protein [Sinorhizobium terangae]
MLVARPKAEASCCPCCGRQTRRIHSHYVRRLADLPWQGRVVEIRLHARRFRSPIRKCRGRISTERLPETVPRKRDAHPASAKANWRSASLSAAAPGSRLSHKLAMPVSGDTLLRMIRVAEVEPPEARAWSASMTGLAHEPR